MTAPALAVFLDGVRLGTVTQSRGGALSLSYDEAYRSRPGATPLSLSMPLTAAEHPNRRISAYLWGLLPDSPGALARLGSEHGVSANNPFSLLRHVGRDAAGAVQLMPDGEDAPDAAVRRGEVEWLSDDDFTELVENLATHADDWSPGRFEGRWSLAGAQPKVALHRDPETGRWGIPRDSTPTTHIIKPVLPQYQQHHVNEFLCLGAAREAGLLAARTEIIETPRVRALVSERYDRVRDASGRWRRVHQEDLCQALSVPPTLKYQTDGGPGVAQIADLILRLGVEDRQISARRFLEALAFNVLIGGTDAHAKNYSMMLAGGRAQLAPLYDVASAAAYDQYRRLVSPMRIGDHTYFLDVTVKDWAKIGTRLRLGGEAVAVVEDLGERLPSALSRAAARLPDDLNDTGRRMVERIIEHVERRWRPNLDRNPAEVLP